ncbi:helix-turn-helix domain-containing protein [Photobacterium damselae]|uniref:helix-turn-helix domain-containing protein n=1 Tax=Photobacterium damselae TaxID=38293 RepID=UPI00370CF3CF
MNWTIDQLIAFVSAVETGSFSAAARRLGKAQSRVSSFMRTQRAYYSSAKGYKLKPGMQLKDKRLP